MEEKLQPVVCYFNVDRQSEVCRLKLAGISRYARLRGWKVETVYEQEAKTWMPPCGSDRIVGCIVECGWGARRFPQGRFGRARVVYLDCAPTDYGPRSRRVVHDSVATAEWAARELLDLNLPRYAYVGWPVRVFWSDVRKKAFCEVLRREGKPCSVLSRCVSRGEEPKWRRALADWLHRLQTPCGILAANDWVARQIADVAADLRLDVPKDLAIMGIDNALDCESRPPLLCSIQIDFEEAGYLAAARLDDYARTGNDFFGPLAVLRRDSVRNFSKMGKRIVQAMECIRSQACSGLDVSDVQRVLGGARRTAELAFRRATGRSILAEIQSVRLEQLVHYLARTTIAIDDLPALCGYRTPWAMRKAFRKWAGVAPQVWRRKMQSGNPLTFMRKSAT